MSVQESDLFCKFDPEWRCTFSSDADTFSEHHSPIVVGLSFSKIFPALNESELQQQLRSTLEEHGRFECNDFHTVSNRWHQMRIYRTSSGFSVFVRTSPANKQSTETVTGPEMARELEKQSQMFAITLSHITDFAYIFDREGRFLYVNRPLLELWGIPLEQALGKNFFELKYPHELAVRLQKQIQDVIATKSVIRDETLYVSPTGVKGIYEYIFAPVFNESGNVDVVAGSTRNITDRKTAQEELERRVQVRTAELTEANQQLETVVYSIAHDLRAPLRSMQGFAEMLLSEFGSESSEAAQMCAGRIARAAKTMDALTLDLLKYGRISRGQLKLEAVSVGLAWKTALEQQEAGITRTSAEITTASALATVLAHGATLAQVLSNLLGNSLKFTKNGDCPRIRFWTEENGKRTRICMEDQGIGIAPEYHDRIFRVFERLNVNTYEGTGIGLAIVRKGTERMQGTLGLESDLGKGTRFWLEFATC